MYHIFVHETKPCLLQQNWGGGTSEEEWFNNSSQLEYTEKLPISQGHISFTLQYFATKLCNFTTSRMLFQAVMYL
jgi:hypothetical protein